MPSVKEKVTVQTYLFGEIYKNTKMGTDAILNLLLLMVGKA